MLGPGSRLVNVSSNEGAGFVAACSPERRKMLTDPNVTWAEIERTAEAYVKAAGDDGALQKAGFPPASASLGAYGLSKALVNALTLVQARRRGGEIPPPNCHALHP